VARDRQARAVRSLISEIMRKPESSAAQKDVRDHEQAATAFDVHEIGLSRAGDTSAPTSSLGGRRSIPAHGFALFARSADPASTA